MSDMTFGHPNGPPRPSGVPWNDPPWAQSRPVGATLKPLPWQVAATWAKPDRRGALAIVVVGLAFAVAMHGQVAGIATVGLAVVLVAALLASGRLRSTGARVTAVAALPIAALLAVRTSPWVIPTVALVVGAGILVGVSHGGGGHVRQLSFTGAAVRVGRSLLSLFGAPVHLAGSLAALLPVKGVARRQRFVALARGLALAIPVVLVLGALLASADLVFASALRLPFGADEAASDVALVALGALVASWLLVDAAADPLDEIVLPMRVLGPIESGVVLGAVAALYAAFATVQVVAARGGANHVLDTAGLTYASYAREGFFQLLAVAGLTLVLLLGVRAATKEVGRRTRVGLVVLAEVVVVLTLVIVGVAIVRLGLYEQAFGLTMLRLTSTAVAWWLGAVFVIVGIACADAKRDRRWVGAAIVASFAGLVLAVGIADPEAVVVQRNLARAAAVGRFDVDYVDELSDDAVPALVAGLPLLSERDRAAVLARLCAVPEALADRSWPAWNRAEARADDAREEVCR